VDGVDYTWDNNGNPSASLRAGLLDDGMNSYTYDSANRLIGLDGEEFRTYGYNGLGDRLSQNGMNYTLDLNTSLTQVLDDGENTYTYGIGRISQQNGFTTEYFLGDALGSVRQMTDVTGAITFTQAYDPYGAATVSDGTGQSAYGFTGEQQDVYAGLVYLRARYYDPVDGRFLSRDTWAGDDNRPLSLNRWMYVEGNPIKWGDPSGMIPEEKADEADEFVEKLRLYNVHIKKDWGYRLIPVDPSSLPPGIVTGILYSEIGRASCRERV